MYDETAVQKAIALGVFEQVELCTAEGAHVQTVVIPKFRPRPSVLIWGTRVFKEWQWVCREPIARSYHETFFYTVIPIDAVTDNGVAGADFPR